MYATRCPGAVRTILTLCALTLAAGCEAGPVTPQELPAAARGAPFARGVAPHVVDVSSSGMALDAPSTISGGWTTFRYHNRTGVTHFFIVERMPAGRTVADSRTEVVPVFQDGMDLIMEGRFEDALAAFGRLPIWYFDVVIVGGPGLTAPGQTSEATIHLEPGTYVIECYVKLPDGTFHTSLGMIEGLTVTPATTPTAPPAATIDVTLSNGGMAVSGSPRPGLQTFAVHFAEQRVHENFVGHDVHLVRLERDTDIDAVAAWMDWTAPAGLATAAPAMFLGGVQEMPAGGTGYFRALLRPGRYALIAEVPNADSKNLLHTFTVPASAGLRP